MFKKQWFPGKAARIIYTIFAALIIIPLIILWGKASLLGMIAVICIVFLPILAIWAFNHGRNRNLKRPAAKS